MARRFVPCVRPPFPLTWLETPSLDGGVPTSQIEIPSASFRFRDEGGVEPPLAGRQLGFNKMVRGRSTPVILGGHFHVTRFGMFRSRAGIALNPWSTAASPRLPTGTGPFSTLKRRHPDSASFTEQGEE